MSALNHGGSAAADQAAPRPIPGETVEVVYDWDIASDRIVWGANFGALIGHADVEPFSTGVGFAEHVAPESPASRYEAVMESVGEDAGGGVPFKVIYGLFPARRSDLAPVWVEDCGRWFADAQNRPRRVHGVVRIVPKPDQRDPTAPEHRGTPGGAFTRAQFLEHVARQLSLCARKASNFAILVLGLDVADDFGEEATAAAVQRLRGEMRGHEVIGNLGRARFGLLLEDCGALEVEAAADRLLATLNGAGGIAARAGAVVAPMQGRAPNVLLQFAEGAYEATLRAEAPPFLLYRPEFSLPEPTIHTTPAERVQAALAEDRVRLALQPVVRAASREVAFYEGLVRIKENGAILLPDQIVPEAERDGLVQLIDRRVIELAFMHLTSDRRLTLSINASVVSVNDPVWLETLQACCRRRADAARRLTVEITETCVIANFDRMRELLGKIRKLGVKIAVDDFGSGHSSFRNLRELPVDYLKIDGAFAQNLVASEDDRFFIRTLIELARNLRLPTVAEWVEDEATASILTEWGVDFLQGHYFGKAELLQP